MSNEKSSFLSYPIIQIAGIKDLAEAQQLIQLGCHALGFPLRLPINQADQTEAKAAEIIKTLPPNIHSILICYETQANEIQKFASFLGTSIVQLHNQITLKELKKLRLIAPELIIIKSLIVRTNNTPELELQIQEQSSWVDLFITDSHNPITGADGATGLTHDWRISQHLIKICPKPIILAGGLTPGNVVQAIEQVRPFGIDVHTGIEGPDGYKSSTLTQEFITQAQQAFLKISQKKSPKNTEISLL